MMELEVFEKKERLIAGMLLSLTAALAMLLLCIILRLPLFILVLLLPFLWIALASLGRNAGRLVLHKPLCRLREDEITLTAAGKKQTLKWKDMKEARLIRTSHSLRLFLFSDKARHPSGAYCISIVAYRDQAYLSALQKQLTDCFHYHHKKIS